MSDWLPNPEQREIAEAMSEAIATALPLDRLHRAGAHDQDQLRELGALGVLGMAQDEELGGSGLSVVEEALIFERLGYQLASPVILGTVLAAHVALPDLASQFCAGTQGAGLAVQTQDDSILIMDAPSDLQNVLILAPSGTGLIGIAKLKDRKTCDAKQWGMALDQAKVSGLDLDAGLGLRAQLLIAAQLTGLAARARDMAVDYTKIREQFGKPIGSFQAVKHHCANMAVQSLASADQMAFAATALSQGRTDAGFQIQAAVSVAIRAARFNAATNIQIHGGIGFSDECDAHLVLKHAHVWETLAGGLREIHADLLKEASPLGTAA